MTFASLLKKHLFKVPRGWFSKRGRQRRKSRKKYGGIETFKKLIQEPSFLHKIKRDYTWPQSAPITIPIRDYQRKAMHEIQKT